MTAVNRDRWSVINNQWSEVRFMAIWFLTLVLGAAAGGSASAQSYGPGISASIEPPHVSTDDTTRLTVTVVGASVTEPELPVVGGLHFLPAGQSSQMRSVNGAVSTLQSYTYQVIAEQEGNYIIPPIRARINGVVHETEPVSLRVQKGSEIASSLRMPPVSTRIATSRRQTPPSSHEPDSPAFLRVHVSNEMPHIGELVPVQIKAYFQEGLQASLNSLPALNGSAFTLQSLNDEPQRSREVVDNKAFTVLTWYTGMSAIKEGEYPVSAHLDATLLVPRQSRARSRSSSRRNPFGGNPFDGFFDDDFLSGFFGNMQEKNISLGSAEQPIRVMPLPTEGRPEHFTGAVGHFDVTAEANPRRLTAGDPVTLHITVAGYGNFDRVSKPRLGNEEGLKVYPPTAGFAAADAIGYEGTKTFEQVVIPENGSVTEIPSIEFAFFDSQAGEYRAVRTDPIPLQIEDAPAGVSGTVSRKANEPVTAAAPEPTGIELEQGEEIAHAPTALNHNLGTMTRNLRPVLYQPWFIGLQALPFTALWVGVILHRRNKSRIKNPALLRTKQANRAVAGAISSMERAIRGGDATGFFSACRTAVQERLGDLWGVQPLAITVADVRRRMPDAMGLRDVFETADAVAYSGRTYTQNELRNYMKSLKNEIATLGHGS